MRRTTIALAFALLVPAAVFAQSPREKWVHLQEKTQRALEQARAASLAAHEARRSDLVTAEKVTSALSLTSYRIFADADDGNGAVVGEVQNVSGDTLTFPNAIFDFSGDSGFLGSYSSFAFGSQNGRVASTGQYTNILPPGAIAFFEVLTMVPYDQITQFSFRSEAETFALAPVFASVPLGPIGLGANVAGGTDFSGTARNASGSFTTFFTEVALAGYLDDLINDVAFTDVSGATIAICGTTSTSAVFPGATVPYNGSFDRPVTAIGRMAVEWDEYGITPAAATFAASGGGGSVAIVGNCAWDAVSNVAWIHVTSGASGSGDATVSFSVDANTQQARTGTMTIAGQTFTVTQEIGPCTYAVMFPFTTVPVSGASGVATVTAQGGCAWTASSSAPWIMVTPAGGTSNGSVAIAVAKNPSSRSRSATVSLAGQLFTITQLHGPVPGDFDGDGSADVTVFRPGDGTWYSLQSTTNFTVATGRQWGNGLDMPVPGDYDGDGKVDIAIFRPSNGTWYIVNSSTGTTIGIQWGNGSDVPVPGDYNGDGRTDVAVFRPSDGTWYIWYSGTSTTIGIQWGNGSDVPLAGDYDGDGKTDVAVFRPSNGTWYIVNSSTGGPVGIQWGNGSDVPVPADYDGDGKIDVAVFRPSDGTWYIVNSGTGSTGGVQWGNGNDVPVPGDYDGDGKTDIAVFRPSNGTWYIVKSSTGTPVGIQWGNGADVPILKRP